MNQQSTQTAQDYLVTTAGFADCIRPFFALTADEQVSLLCLLNTAADPDIEIGSRALALEIAAGKLFPEYGTRN